MNNFLFIAYILSLFGPTQRGSMFNTYGLHEVPIAPLKMNHINLLSSILSSTADRDLAELSFKLKSCLNFNR